MDLTFPDKHPDEEIFAVVRKHTVVYAKLAIGFFILVVLPPALFFYLWFSAHSMQENFFLNSSLLLFACLYFLYGMLYTCIKWIDEEFDIFIVTNQRLIDITQISFFRRTESSTPLEHIQDITSSVNGIVPTLFGYGDLTIKTAAGATSDFFIDRVPDPAATARNIMSWVKDRREKIQGQPSEDS